MPAPPIGVCGCQMYLVYINWMYGLLAKKVWEWCWLGTACLFFPKCRWCWWQVNVVQHVFNFLIIVNIHKTVSICTTAMLLPIKLRTIITRSSSHLNKSNLDANSNNKVKDEKHAITSTMWYLNHAHPDSQSNIWPLLQSRQIPPHLLYSTAATLITNMSAIHNIQYVSLVVPHCTIKSCVIHCLYDFVYILKV